MPTVQGNAAYPRVTRAARAALEAAAQVVLSEAQWRHVDDVLAAFVPDFGREQSDAERGELIKAVVQALTVLHGRAAGTVQAWQGAHRGHHLTLACVLEQDSNRALQQLLSVSNTCSGQVLDFSNTSSRPLSPFRLVSAGSKAPQQC